jgi:tetratricopeptide (TPR) repeat protein
MLTFGVALGFAAHAQVSERVVRELIALEVSRFEWRYLVNDLARQGETDLAVLVLDSRPMSLAGRLYEWHRGRHDVLGMLHEFDARSTATEPLPAVVEDAVMLGGRHRAMVALEHVRANGLKLERNYLLQLKKSGGASPEFLTYFVLANEGRIEEANALLPLITREELAEQSEAVNTLAYRGDSRLAGAIVRAHPNLLRPTVMLDISAVHSDTELEEAAIKRILYDEEAPLVACRAAQYLIVSLVSRDRVHTARRIASRTWGSLAQEREGSYDARLDRAAVQCLIKLGFDSELEQLASDLAASARSRVAKGKALVEDISDSPSRVFAEAVMILVLLGMESESEALLDEFDALYKDRRNSMSLVGEGLRTVKMEALFDMGRYDEALAYALKFDLNSYRSPLPLSAIKALMADGRKEQARDFLTKFLRDQLPTESRALGDRGYWIVGDLARPMVELDMQDELRAWLLELFSSGRKSFVAANAYAALGDFESARAHADDVMASPYRENCLSGVEIMLWKSATGRTWSELATVAAPVYQALLDKFTTEGVFVGRWPRGWAVNYVTALKFVHGDRKMTELLLDNLEQFFASLPQDMRVNAEYDALREAVRGPQLTPDAVHYFALPTSLQERVLDIIVRTRSRPLLSSR